MRCASNRSPPSATENASVIVAFSTSSPVASLAVFSPEGGEVWSGRKPAQGRASEAILTMLSESGVELRAVELWLADLGPGSFTGTRVGVVLAKTLAWTHGRECGGASSFDLIALDRTVAIPNRKAEWLVRVPGEAPKLLPAGEIEAIGYAPGLADELHPDATRFAALLSGLERLAPERLVPGYVVPPSISQPKRPIP